MSTLLVKAPFLAFACLLTLISAAPAQTSAADEASAAPFGIRLSEAALERTRKRVIYDDSYVRMAYPMGDVPDDRGVCTDVVIRSYRALGTDLQKLVHDDMRRNFGRYPRSWGLSRPDSNIDHRRVPNLETFLRRKGAELPISDDPADYRPGDLVSYRLPGGLPHIAVVSSRMGPEGRPLMVHNIGGGTQLEDFLFSATVNGHFRFHPGEE